MSDTGPVVATGRVQLSADSKQLTTSISSELGKLGGPLGQIANIGKQATDKLKGSFDGTKGAVSAVGLGIAAVGLAAAAFAVKSVSAFVDVGKEVLKLQRYTGGTAETMSKLRFAAQQSGVGADQLANSLKFLSKNIESGKGDLAALGVTTLDAHGKMLPLDDILFKVADKFKSMPNGAEKTAAALKIFGKAGADMIPMLNKGGAALKALEDEAQKYGLVLTGSNLDAIKKSIAAHREQTAAMQGLQVQIGSQVLPVMTKLTQALTTGLLAVMPAITAVVQHGVVPAFTALATVMTAVTGFLSQHSGAVKIAGAVIGSVMVPALVAWGAAQARVAASSVISFIAGVGRAALDGAVSVGLLANADNYATVTMTAMAAAAGAVALGIGLIVLQNRQMQDSANKTAQAIVNGAKSPQAAIADLTAKQAEYHKEMQGGVTILGAHIFATDAEAKKSAQASKGYAATTAQLKSLNDAQKATVDSTTEATDAIGTDFTTMGLKIQNLGGATKLTSDQVQELADHLGIDLTKNAGAATAKLVDAAHQLSYSSVATQRLGADTQVLSSWMSNASDRAKAFHDALDALVGTQVSAEQTSINFHQALSDTVDKLKAVKYSTDLTTQSGRDQQSQIASLVDATKAQIESDQNSGLTLDQLRPKIEAHVAELDAALEKSGLLPSAIKAINAQYSLTPAALAQVTPAIDGQTAAWGGLTGAIGGTGTALANLEAQARQDVGNIAASTAALSAIAANSRSLNASAAASLAGNTGGFTHSGFTARASGGPVYAGRKYWVGEHGPEPFYPTTDGEIAPSNPPRLAVDQAASQPVRSYTTASESPVIRVYLDGQLAPLINKVRVSTNSYNVRAGVVR